MNNALIVESDLPTRLALTRAFSSNGLLCDIAVNEEEAFEALSWARERGERYFLAVFTTALFAGPFGKELLSDSHLRRTGAQGYTRIVLTQHSATGDAILTGFRSGCDGFLELPVNQAELNRLFLNLKT